MCYSKYQIILTFLKIVIFDGFHLFYFFYFSYAFSNRLAVAILRLSNGLDFSLGVEDDTTPPNGLTTPSSSFTNFNNMETGISNTNLRKDLLQSQSQNGGASTIMHADSYLNIYKIPSNNTAACKCYNLIKPFACHLPLIIWHFSKTISRLRYQNG